MGKYKNCIYRFLNKDNEIIYIGKAKDLKQRISSHTHLPDKCYDETKSIEFVMFDTEDDMNFAERYYIPKYNPMYNTIWAERNITLNIPDLDNKHWLKYTNDKDIEIQILKLEGKWIEPKVLVTKEDYDKEIELLKEEYNSIMIECEVMRDKIDLLEDNLTEHSFVKKIESENNVHFSCSKLIFEDNKKWEEVYFEFDEDFDRLCIECSLEHDKYTKMIDKCVELEENILNLKKERLTIVLGKKKTKELNKVLYEEYIKHEVYSKEELIVDKIKHIRDRYFNIQKEKVQTRDFYDIHYITNMVYSDMGLGMWPDKWTEEFNKEELESSANICIDKIKEKFTKTFGEFKQEVILSEEPATLAPTYKIPTALLVMKLVK